MMLVPALIPLCLADGAAREITASGSLPLALAAVGVHMVAMLVVTGVVACGLCVAIKKGRQIALAAFFDALTINGRRSCGVRRRCCVGSCPCSRRRCRCLLYAARLAC